MSFGFGFSPPASGATPGGPTLNLQFAGVTTLDPRITFTRASSATYFDSTGTLVSAGNNVARLTYNPTTLAADGLLIEEQRTNLLTFSESMIAAAWGTDAGASPSATTSLTPSGSASATRLTEDTSTGQHATYSVISGLTAGTAYTWSLFVKAGARSRAQVFMSQGANAAYALANLSAGTISAASIDGGVWTNASSSIQNAGNGWYRITITATIVGSTALAVRVRIANDAGSVSYTGNGTGNILVWGAQLEAGAFPTSYIPTVAAQVTRSADSASMTGTNFSSWYNATEGTLYAEFGPYANAGVSGNTGIAQIYGATSSDTIRLFGGATTVPVFQVSVGGVSQAYLNVGTLIPANTTKLVGAYKADDFAKSLNGGAIDSDTSGTVPTVNQMLIGSGTGGITSLNGTIARIAFYPRRLTNAELQAITA